MSLPRARAIGLAVLLFGAAACSRAAPDSTPEGAVHVFLDRMEAVDDGNASMKDAYALLGPATRKNLEDRASRAGRIQGRRIEPYEMLAGRFALKFRPKSMTAHAQGDTAVVDVQGYDARETAQVRTVREGGAYKVELDLPDVTPLPQRRDPRDTHEPRDARDARDGGDKRGDGGT